MTALKGADGEVYAVAQGDLIVGGFGAEGRDGSRVTVNVPSAGRIPSGATVERAVPSGFLNDEHLVFNLLLTDFTSANRITRHIHDFLGASETTALVPGDV